MGDRPVRRNMQRVAGVHAAEHLTVNQVECTLPGNNAPGGVAVFFKPVTMGFMRLFVQRRDGFVGMPRRMAQRMGQRSLLGRQQQEHQRPPQCGEPQDPAEERKNGHCRISDQRGAVTATASVIR